MPRARVASAETYEFPSLSRPARVRQAPERLNLSSFNASHQRSSSSSRSLEQKESNWTKSLRECEEEESYVSNYTYSHVGEALRGKSPSSWDCWVEVPLLEARKPRISTDSVEGILENSRKENQQIAPFIPTEKETPFLLSADVDSEDHAAPTQDQPVVEAADSSIEQDELEDSVEADQPLSSPIEEDAVEESATNKLLLEKSKGVQPQVADDTGSSGSQSFVDALAEELEVEESVPVISSKSSLQIDHPETRLSHSRDEVATPLPTAMPRSSSKGGVRVKDNGIAGRSLFFGSDSDDDESNDTRSTVNLNRQQQNGASSSSKSTLHQEDRLKLAADKGKQRGVTPRRQNEEASAEASKTQKDHSSGKEKKKHRSEAIDNGALEGKKKRKRTESVGAARKSNRSSKKSKRDSEDDDLVQNLNIDAVANPRSHQRVKATRAKALKRMQKQKRDAERKRQGKEVSSSESSSSGESDDTDSSSDSDPSDFIVDDDEPNSSIHQQQHKGAKKIPMPGRTLPPPTIMREDLLSGVRSMGRREKLEEYIRWMIAYMLDLEITPRQRSVRANLREMTKADYDSITTQANRRQFTWYLKHYPFFERRMLTKQEKEEHIGCAACGKKKQKCEYLFTLWGPFYNPETLYGNSDYTSSDCTTEGEDNDWKTKSEDEKKIFFYLGDSCAKYASVKHRLWHWERRVLNDVNKLPSFKALKARRDRNKSKYDPEDDIEAVVAYYYPTLASRRAKLLADAQTVNLKVASYTRLKEKWDDNP